MSTIDRLVEDAEIRQPLREPKQIGELLIEYLHSNEPLAVALRAHLTGEALSVPCTESTLDVSDWLDGSTAEDLLGVSTRTLQHYRDTGILPFSKVGNKIYYKRSDLSAMIERHYQKGGYDER